MATGPISSSETATKSSHQYDVTVSTMKKLLAIMNKRTGVQDPHLIYMMAARKMANHFMLACRVLKIQDGDAIQSSIPIYFCSEFSSQSLEVVLAYCYSAFCNGRDDQLTVISIFYTLIVNLSGGLFENEINSLLKDKYCFAVFKSFPERNSMLTAMIDDKFVSGVSEMLNRQKQVLKSKYENQLCLIAYLFIVALKDNKLRMKNVLKPFAEAVNATACFETIDIRTLDDKKILDDTFENMFDFRNNIFKHLVSLATREDQLGNVLRLVIEELQFVKMEKFFIIEKYFTPYCPSILNFHEMKSPALRSVFSKFASCSKNLNDAEKPYIWFLEEYLDDLKHPLLNCIVGFALAIKEFKEPEFDLRRSWRSPWYSQTAHRMYNMRKENVFEYLRRFELIKDFVQSRKSGS